MTTAMLSNRQRFHPLEEPPPPIESLTDDELADALLSYTAGFDPDDEIEECLREAARRL